MNEQDLFIEALSRQSPEQRREFLDQACRESPTLRCRIDRLLEHGGAAGEFLEQPPCELLDLTVAEAVSLPLGTRVGPYKLREQIGEGGMGVVYVAEQVEPVKRKVALKLIKPGMDSRQVVARFEAERQALAMMDHPNIARVFDGGATETGQPFFVMELVQGLPITEYCDQQGLDARERLRAFVQVCRAVQHAHQKGIIHRDLKPSNVLAPVIDGEAIPKVIDFGVAKAVNEGLTEQTVYTHFAQMVGTPLYMSPEQAGLGVTDVDTRSDIYSLGVLLYELLTGSTPFDGEALKRAGFDEMRRIIREEEPPRPSVMVSTLNAQALSTVAQRHGSDPRALSSSLAGELDWIVMKALEKDRARRYETASKLAEDVESYLNDEPVAACPPSAVYQLRKFLHRNKAAMLTGGMLVVALLLGLGGASWGLWQARHQRDAAMAEQRRADAEAAAATAISNFLRRDLLGMAGATNQLAGGIEPNPDVKLATLLHRARETLGDRFKDQPVVKAKILYTLGAAFTDIGRYDAAEESLSLALGIFEDAVGREHPAAWDAMNTLAYVFMGQGRYSEAEARFRELLDTQQRVLGVNRHELWAARNGLALSIKEQGRHADAEQVFRELLDTPLGEPGDEYADSRLDVMSNLALAVLQQGRLGEAEQRLRALLEIRQRVQGPEHPDTMHAMHNLALAFDRQGHHAEAERLYGDLLAIRKRVQGVEHPDTLKAMNNLANTLVAQGKHEEAEPIEQASLRIRQRSHGVEHPATLRTASRLAATLMAQGRKQESLSILRQVVDILRRTRGADHSETTTVMRVLASSLVVDSDASQQDAEEAVLLCQEVLEVQPDDGFWLAVLGASYYRSGQWDSANDALNKSLTAGFISPEPMLFLAMANWRLGNKEAARQWCDKSAKLRGDNEQHDIKTRRLRSEANELLGIPDAKAVTSPAGEQTIRDKPSPGHLRE